jgi:hypothetical protein
VLHVEFETGYDNQLKSRLLIYNAILYRDHRLPVITLVMYPFRTTVAKSPLCILSQNEPILTFVFQTFPLFELNAGEVMQQHQACMYPLLPTMENVDADLMEHAMQELVEIYRDDRGTLAEQFVWIKLFLERTTTITLEKKEQIKGRLSMFDQLFKDSPTIQKLREEDRVQFLEQGIQQGVQKERQERLQALQGLLVNLVQARYPDLAVFAQQQASRFGEPYVLELLIQQVMAAPDADAARRLLESGPQM